MNTSIEITCDGCDRGPCGEDMIGLSCWGAPTSEVAQMALAIKNLKRELWKVYETTWHYRCVECAVEWLNKMRKGRP